MEDKLDTTHVCHNCPLQEKFQRLFDASVDVNEDVGIKTPHNDLFGYSETIIIYSPCDYCNFKDKREKYLWG